MPSWNIHIAHAQRLLEREGAAALGIRDEAAFLFGNVLPDVGVGFVVAHPVRTIDYRESHLAKSAHIPLPDADLFWERYVAGCGPSDAVLGAWCHLVCDREYNALARRVAAARHLEPGDELRERKQSDFELFGRTLDARARLEATGEVIAQAASFPQYEVVEADVRAAVEAGNALLDAGGAAHAESVPAYRLFGADDLARAFDEIQGLLARGLGSRCQSAHF